MFTVWLFGCCGTTGYSESPRPKYRRGR